jgi:hypothetical protein
VLKKFTVNLDIEQTPSNTPFIVTTMDSNSVNITINVLESSVAKAVTGTTCVLDIMKPDGTVVPQSCTISNGAGGVLTVTLPATAISLVGNYKAFVKITDVDASVCTTNTFAFSVTNSW